MTQIRWMTRRDMRVVLDIEYASFQFPWPMDDFLHVLRRIKVVGMIIEVDDRIVGFMVYELHKTRLHLLNLAISRHYRRQGLGTQLINKALLNLGKRIFTVVREYNLEAQLFFRSQGFKAVSALKGYYEDSDEDAYVFTRRCHAENLVESLS